MLVALDVYPGLWLGRPGEPGRPGGAVSELEALPDRIRELRQLDAGLADAVDAKAARLAATFAHLPAGAGRGPLDFLKRFRDAGYLSRAATADVALLELQELPEDELGRRRFLHQAGRLWPTAACSLGARTADAGRWRAALRPLARLASKEGAAILDPPRLLTGEEVQELLGIAPGPEVGKALASLRQAQVDGTVRTREEAVAMLSGRSPSSSRRSRR